MCPAVGTRARVCGCICDCVCVSGCVCDPSVNFDRPSSYTFFVSPKMVRILQQKLSHPFFQCFQREEDIYIL